MLFAVLILGTILTLVLVLVTRSAHVSNEDRLLSQRVREAAAVVTAALPGIETPLASAVEVVEVTDGADQDAFRRLMKPLVNPGWPYISASLWRLDDPLLKPTLVIGTVPKMSLQPPPVVRAFFDRSAATDELAVVGLLDGEDPRLGYSFTSLIRPFALLHTSKPSCRSGESRRYRKIRRSAD